MQPLLEILAAGQSRDGQWVVIVIVFAIWVISAIVNSANKKADQVRQQQLKNAMQQIPPAVPNPVPLAPGIAMRVPAQVRTPNRAATRAPNRTPNRAPARGPANSIMPGAVVAANLASMQQRRAVVPPPISSNRIVLTAPSRPDIAASEISSAAPTAAAKPSVGATALHRWLRPETLRQQFIITEVLQQPVALRQPRLS